MLADTDSELSEINVVCCIGTVEIQIYKSKYKKVGVLPIWIIKSEINIVCCVCSVQIQIEIKVGVLPIWIVKFNVSSVGRSSERNRK